MSRRRLISGTASARGHESFAASLYGVQARQSCAVDAATAARATFRARGATSRATAIDDIILGVRISGRSILSRERRRPRCRSRARYICRSRRPLEIKFLTQTTSIFVSIPRKALHARVGARRSPAKACRRRPPVAGLAAEFLTMLAARTDTLEAPVQARLAEQALDLIALALTAGDGTPMLSSPRASALLRLKMVDRRAPQRSKPQAGGRRRRGGHQRALCQRPARRGELFRSSATSCSGRLERCRSALEDPLQAHRMIGEIAFSWGFSDHSHFTRRFRAEFGMTPGDCRRAAAGGTGDAR